MLLSGMHKYRLGLEKLDAAVGGVSGGSGILIEGPPASGKQAIVYSLVRQGLEDGEGVILVPTMETGANALSSFGDIDNLRIIDCMSRPMGLEEPDSVNVKHVNGPADLTGMGIWAGRLMDEFKGKPVRLCIDSLSTLLMYSSLQVIFRFLHLLNGRLQAAGGLSIGVVDEGMHDEKTMASLRQLYRAVLELKEADNACRVRAVGLGSRPTPWFKFEEVIE
jgi:KaiC/GvpD/RAD55 family RecA-like ATPase